MSYGLLIKNAAGNILIDGEYFNYSLLASGTLNTGVSSTVSFSASVATPIVFVRLQSTTQWVALSALSLSSATFKVYGSVGAPSASREQEAGTIEYMIFGLAKSLSPSGAWGLNVFNASGELVYDSNVRTPRVSEVVSVASIDIVSFSARQPISAVSHSSGSSPWMMVNHTLFYYGHYYYGSGFLADLYQPCIRSASGGQIQHSVGRLNAIGTTGTRWSAARIATPLMQFP